jgi:hypothetical protein
MGKRRGGRTFFPFSKKQVEVASTGNQSVPKKIWDKIKPKN